MDRWVAALEDQLVKQNDTYSRCTSFLRTKLGAQVKRVKCGKCDSLTWIGALIKFPCEKIIGNDVYEVEHTLCFDCLEDKLERHRGFLERERTNPNKKALYDKCLEAVVCCEECHTPAVISRKVGYEGGIQDQGGDEGGGRRRVRYMINQDLTMKLKDLWFTKSFYENQRRSPFSKFSKDKLFRIERPHISDETGKPAPGERQELEEGFVWLEDWRVVANVTIDEIQKKSTVAGAAKAGGGSGPTASGSSGGPNATANSLSPGASASLHPVLSETITEQSFLGLSKSGDQSSANSPATGSGGKGYNTSNNNASSSNQPDQAIMDQISQTVTDPSGWQYAFLWPVPDGYIKWDSKPTANTYVRRRKKLRAYLRLTPELRDALKEFARTEAADQKNANM